VAVGLLLLAPNGCSKNPPEFFPVPDQTREQCSRPLSPGSSGCTKSETFIIANCPSGPRNVIRAVHEFDSRTLTDSKLAPWTRYRRVYYRETSATPRDFKGDNQDWGGDSLDDHWQDVVVTTDYWGSLASRQTSYWVDGVAGDPP
jgi:hypothetical protein